MRNKSFAFTLIVLMSAAHACVAAPPPPAPPPQPVQQRPAATTQPYEFVMPTRVEIPSGGVLFLDGRPAAEKAAFLGVSVSTVTGALRQQLKLKPGVGLVVNHVEPDSPAAAAGVKQYDIIERLDDQLLIEPRQLSVLIRLHKAGDEVKLALIRQGQPTSVTAKLSEKDLPALEDVLVPTQNTPWKMITPYGVEKGVSSGKTLALRSDYNRALALDGGGGGASGLNWSDGDVTMEIVQDKARHLTARSKDGVVLFDGEINTPEQMQKLPAEIRAKAMRLVATTAPAASTQPANVQYRNTFKGGTFNRVPGGSPVM